MLRACANSASRPGSSDMDQQQGHPTKQKQPAGSAPAAFLLFTLQGPIPKHTLKAPQVMPARGSLRCEFRKSTDSWGFLAEAVLLTQLPSTPLPVSELSRLVILVALPSTRGKLPPTKINVK